MTRFQIRNVTRKKKYLQIASLWVARKVQVSHSGSAAVNLNCLLFFHKSRHKQKSFLQSELCLSTIAWTQKCIWGSRTSAAASFILVIIKVLSCFDLSSNGSASSTLYSCHNRMRSFLKTEYVVFSDLYEICIYETFMLQ